MCVAIPVGSVVAFDLDDTLYMEIDFLKSGFRKVADLIVLSGFDDPFEQLIQYHMAGLKSFQKVISENKLPFDASELVTVYREHLPDIKLRGGALDLLNKLRRNKCILGLVTDGRSLSQRQKINALKIGRFFDDLIISEEFGSEKPAERNYRYFMEKYPGRQFFYIGDNYNKDFIAPNRLGWRTIAIRHPSCIHKIDEKPGREYLPHYLISDFKDIIIDGQ